MLAKMVAIFCIILFAYRVIDVYCDWRCWYDMATQKSLADWKSAYSILLLTCLCSTYFILKFLYDTCCECCEQKSANSDEMKVFWAKLNFSLVEVLANFFQAVIADFSIKDTTCLDRTIGAFAGCCCIGGVLQFCTFLNHCYQGVVNQSNDYCNRKCVNILGLIISVILFLPLIDIFVHATNVKFC